MSDTLTIGKAEVYEGRSLVNIVLPPREDRDCRGETYTNLPDGWEKMPEFWLSTLDKYEPGDPRIPYHTASLNPMGCASTHKDPRDMDYNELCDAFLAAQGRMTACFLNLVNRVEVKTVCPYECGEDQCGDCSNTDKYMSRKEDISDAKE